jgi:DNA-binding transcriptional LysR family regulator
MELRQMRSFVALAQTLHFGQASEVLHLSQPALSLQIQQLEKELDVKLLERSSRHVRLTPAGQKLLLRIQAVLKGIDDAVTDTKRVAEGLEGLLSISYVTTALVGVLPHAMRLFQKRLPHAELQLNGSRPHEQIAHLLDGTTDIGFMHVGFDFDVLESKVVQRDELVVAIPSEMDDGGPVDLKRFKDHTVIMPVSLSLTSFDLNSQVKHSYHLAGVEPSRVIHANVVNAICLVAFGVGISLVPSCFQNLDIKGVKYRPLTVRVPPAELLAVWNGKSKSGLLHQFLAILNEQSC